MRIPLYQVDAFTSRLFGGNPAAVCPLTEWLPERTMQAIAAENNLAETAFFVPQGDGYLLRCKDWPPIRTSPPSSTIRPRPAAMRTASREPLSSIVAGWPRRPSKWW